jgi:hypothetical protein
MLCSIIFKIIIIFIIYIEGSMCTFIIYIGIIQPKFRFDYINFKTSLVIKIINFNENLEISHPTMLVIFLWMWFLVKISIYHTFITSLLKNSFFEMKIYKLVTWFILCEMTWCNIPSTFIKTKIYLNYFLSIFVFLSTKVHYNRFHKYTPISHFIKWNEIVSFLISRLRLYSNIICKNKLWKSFESLRWGTLKHAQP